MKNKYQFGFSEIFKDELYNLDHRKLKAEKIVVVLSEHYNGKIKDLSVLDVGCSTGIISHFLGKHFKSVYGVDIDAPAVGYANDKFSTDNVQFGMQDAMNFAFGDDLFDVVICAHIYEHVPDSSRLMAEIHRVLKPGGVCFFAAGNRMKLLEGHYKLPFLSMMPKKLAHLYLRIIGRGDFYYENLLSYWGLRKLVSNFEIIDYTSKIIGDPIKYKATDVVKSRNFKGKIVKFAYNIASWISPAYIWLLEKKKNS